MTIFQKMIAVPVLALFLFSGFLIYSYTKYQHTSVKIEEIRDHYLPLLAIANNNSHLFNEISTNLKDAVLAGEPDWLSQINEKSAQIEHNLLQLMQNPTLINQAKIAALQQSFSLYYQNAFLLAESVIKNQENLLADDNLMQNVERYHQATKIQFLQLQQDIEASFRTTVDETNEVINQLLFVGATIAITIMTFLLTITLAVSISTRRSVEIVINRMKSLALGNTDFSQRLSYKKRDELGYLIHWFNKLSDKLEQDYKTVETISITDKLTQLNNRSRTDSFLPKALANTKINQSQLALIMLDIDHFKKINDTYGHLVGDNVLKSFAEILKDSAREHDFIARWGGEEFIMILPDTGKDTAKVIAEQIRKKVELTYFPEVNTLTISLGVAISTGTDAPNNLIKQADDCLYQAKERGRNCVEIA